MQYPVIEKNRRGINPNDTPCLRASNALEVSKSVLTQKLESSALDTRTVRFVTAYALVVCEVSGKTVIKEN